MARDGRAPRETWRDWLPPEWTPPVITRAELLAETAIGERRLTDWEQVGALPRPARRPRFGDAAALYPVWYPQVVAEALRLRAGGIPPSRLRPIVKIAFQRISTEEHGAAWDATFRPDPPPEALAALREWVGALNRAGLTIAGAELRLRQRDGGDLTYPI